MERKKRINEAVDFLIYKKIILNQEDLGKKMKITKESVSRALNGNKSYLTDKFISRFCSTFPAIDANWLLTGEGNMLKADNTNTASEPKAPYGIDNNQGNDFEIYHLNKMIEEKEKIIKEKDAKIEKLNQEIGALSLELKQLKFDRVEPEKRGTSHLSGKTQVELAGEKSPAKKE